ncbi:hypothetical protein [Thioalkalivibrio sulfidiphilus]|uniref:hypothetical protein n=1 Tax=Thioalkalivibrio sulfidiphilus TaxID=1033854 RepID=UPI00036DE901|nr:hypothetical protein [Thioalkalivibrio sulfidiphilus]
MGIMDTALLVGLGGVLLGYLLVVRAGFHREFAWGVITLIPVVSLAFVMLYWRKARIGFILSILGLMVTAVALYGGADRTVERQLAKLGIDVDIPMPVQRFWEVEVPNEELVRRIEAETGQPLVMVEDNPYAPVDIQPLSPAGSFRVEQAPAVTRAWREAHREELSRLVGEHMRLTISPGATREGLLTSVTGPTLFLSQRTAQGTISFEYRIRDLQSIEVWDVAGARPRIPEPEPELTSEGEPDIIFAPPDSDTPPPTEEQPPLDW